MCINLIFLTDEPSCSVIRQGLSVEQLRQKLKEEEAAQRKEKAAVNAQSTPEIPSTSSAQPAKDKAPSTSVPPASIPTRKDSSPVKVRLFHTTTYCSFQHPETYTASRRAPQPRKASSNTPYTRTNLTSLASLPCLSLQRHRSRLPLRNHSPRRIPQNDLSRRQLPLLRPPRTQRKRTSPRRQNLGRPKGVRDVFHGMEFPWSTQAYHYRLIRETCTFE